MNSNDAYLLKLPKGDGYLWKGKGASEEEERGAKYMSEKLMCKFNLIAEGKEPGMATVQKIQFILFMLYTHTLVGVTEVEFYKLVAHFLIERGLLESSGWKDDVSDI